MRNSGYTHVLRGLERVQYVEVAHEGKEFRLRSELTGTAGRVFQAAGVAAPPTGVAVELTKTHHRPPHR